MTIAIKVRPSMSTYVVTELRLRRLTLALAGGLFLGLLVFLETGKYENTAFYQGDFPAFFAAAEIVWTGRGMDLYDFELQRKLQHNHWPDPTGGFYIFAYPPFFALLLSPLASLSPLVAKGIASVILFAALCGALLLARSTSDFVRRHFLFSLMYLLTLVPMQMAIFGVQNTSISMVLMSLVHWASQHGRPLITGLCASLLLYKPQFGAILFLFILGRFRKDELIGWGLGAIALYLLGALVLGLSWPLVWLKAATDFGALNFTINDYNMISIAGLMYWFSALFTENGASGLPWAYLLSVVILLLSVWYVRQNEKRFLIAPHLMLLLSPQTLFYDVAIAVFYLMRNLRPYNTDDFKILLAIWLYCSIALMFRDLVSFPLFSVLLIAIILIYFRRVNVVIH